MQPDPNDIIYTQYGLSADLFKRAYDFFGGTTANFDSYVQLFQNAWLIYSILAFAASAIFIYGIIYSFIRYGQLSDIETKELIDAQKLWKEIHGSNIGDKRWQSMQTHLESSNPNDWKLAIIEADVLLEHMLKEAGYAGTTIADRLRSASHRSFKTIDDAWQAHRVRNQIAHGGTDFVLTQKKARETLIMYQRVFQEFDVI